MGVGATTIPAGRASVILHALRAVSLLLSIFQVRVTGVAVFLYPRENDFDIFGIARIVDATVTGPLIGEI